MTLENPISNIRNSIRETAEQKASMEFSEKPEERHFEDTLKFYKKLRDSKPELLEKVIIYNNNRKELKDEMGKELFSSFNKVWEQVLFDPVGQQKFKAAMSNLGNRELSSEELRKEKINLYERFYKEKMEELKKDPRIISVSLGKEEILNRFIEHEIAANVDMMETDSKYPTLRVG